MGYEPAKDLYQKKNDWWWVVALVFVGLIILGAAAG